jgi:hypothetical protein
VIKSSFGSLTKEEDYQQIVDFFKVILNTKVGSEEGLTRACDQGQRYVVARFEGVDRGERSAGGKQEKVNSYMCYSGPRRTLKNGSMNGRSDRGRCRGSELRAGYVTDV